MSWNLRPTSEKLYLYRGKDEYDDIFVEAALHQHHIDGIRFLYKQFKRKKPGVILNNPPGYGNSLQVTLFLGAIQHLLKKPILIICEDGEEYNWLELFQKHTQSYHVVVNASNAFVKKSIFINVLDGIEKFVRRPWGAIVVDNEAFLKMKTLHIKFEADYKIWITQVDIKDQLPTFSLIYKWIYPKEKFNAEDFKAKSGDRKDMISKAILLATFLEDLVYRTKLQNPYEDHFENVVKTQLKVSEKNKDATGTKIKRSKRTAEEINNTNPDVSATKLSKVDNSRTPIGINNISVSNLSYGKSESKKSDITDTKDNKHSDLDVESFISTKEPIKNNMHDFDNDHISNESQENKMVLHYSDDAMAGETEAPDSTINTTKTNSPCSVNKTSESDLAIRMSPESDDDAYELETQEFLNGNNMEINDNHCKENNIDEEHPNLEEKSQSIVETTSFDTKNQNTVNNMDVDNGISKETEIPDKQEETTDTVELGEDVREKDKVIIKGSQNNKTEFNNKAVDIDTKITEHEDRIFKKFKGTFLDSIF